MNMNRATEVIILGGGVIGSSTAYYLRKADVEVAVVEKGVVAAEASSAAAGLLAPLDELFTSEAYTRLVLASWSLFPTLIPELEERSGVRVEFSRPGSLHFVPKGAERSIKARMETWRQAGLQATLLTGDEARAKEPLLTSDVEAAIFAPQEASIKPELLTRAYAGAARELGARFYEHTEITGIVRSASRVTGVPPIRKSRILSPGSPWYSSLSLCRRSQMTYPRDGIVCVVAQAVATCSRLRSNSCPGSTGTSSHTCRPRSSRWKMSISFLTSSKLSAGT